MRNVDLGIISFDKVNEVENFRNDQSIIGTCSIAHKLWEGQPSALYSCTFIQFI